MKLNRAQRISLKRIYDKHICNVAACEGITYRQLRRTVGTLVGDPTCIMVRVPGMWLGIEEDGHVHS